MTTVASSQGLFADEARQGQPQLAPCGSGRRWRKDSDEAARDELSRLPVETVLASCAEPRRSTQARSGRTARARAGCTHSESLAPRTTLEIEVEARTSSGTQQLRSGDLPWDGRFRCLVIFLEPLREQLAFTLRDRQSLAALDDAVPQLRDQREPARDIECQEVVEFCRRHAAKIACVSACSSYQISCRQVRGRHGLPQPSVRRCPHEPPAS